MAYDAELGAETAGVWTAAQALAAGLSEGAVARREAAGLWQRLHRGVYCDTGVVPSPLMRGWAAVLARGGAGRAWAAGRTLARLHELPLVDDDDPATGARDVDRDDVVVRAGRVGRSGGLHVSRPALVPGRDTVRVGGCPALSLEHALPGLAAVLSSEALVCLLDAALHRGLLDPAALARAVRRARGGRHAVALRSATTLADGRAESPVESLARLLLLPAVPGLVPQVRLLDRQARVVARLDLGDERLRLAVEADGRRFHAGEVMRASDARRDRTTECWGWRTERVTWFDLRCRQAETVQRVLAAAERQRRRAT